MTKVKLEDHHPEMMKFSAETRRIINAYNGHGLARDNAGWDAVDVELSDILDAAFARGKHATAQ